MYMKTKSTKQTVHNGFGQFPKIVQLKHDYFCNSGHVTPGITYSFTFSSLLPMTVQTYFFLYLRTMRRLAIQPFHLVRNNATSCTPALPVVSLSVSRFYSTSQDATQFIFLRPCTNSNHSNSQHNCTQQNLTYQSLCNTCNPAFQSKSSLNLCNTCNPVQSEMSVHRKSLDTSNKVMSPCWQTSTAFC